MDNKEKIKDFLANLLWLCKEQRIKKREPGCLVLGKEFHAEVIEYYNQYFKNLFGKYHNELLPVPGERKLFGFEIIEI